MHDFVAAGSLGVKKAPCHFARDGRGNLRLSEPAYAGLSTHRTAVFVLHASKLGRFVFILMHVVLRERVSCSVVL